MDNAELKDLGASLAARHTRLNRAREGGPTRVGQTLAIALTAVAVIGGLFGLLFVAAG